MRPRLYDWPTLLAKRRFVLRRGVDYDCSQSSMAQQIRTAAWRGGVKAHIAEGDGEFVVIVEERANASAREQASGSTS